MQSSHPLHISRLMRTVPRIITNSWSDVNGCFYLIMMFNYYAIEEWTQSFTMTQFFGKRKKIFGNIKKLKEIPS